MSSKSVSEMGRIEEGDGKFQTRTSQDERTSLLSSSGESINESHSEREDQPSSSSQRRPGRRSESNVRNGQTSIFKIGGEIVIMMSFGIIIQTVLLAFWQQGQDNIANKSNNDCCDWIDNYWVLCTPIFALTFFLFIFLQSKRVIEAFPTSLRMAFSLFFLQFVALLVMLGFHLDARTDSIEPWKMFVIPWLSILIFIILGIFSLITACGKNSKEQRNRNLLSFAIILFTICLLGPTIFLVEGKQLHQKSYSWTIVFIPWWIVDFFFLFFGCCLLIFSFGSDGFFSLPQLVNFLFCIMTSSAAKAVLGLKLDKTITQPYYIVFIPVWVFLILLAILGISLRVGRSGSPSAARPAYQQTPR